MSAYFLEHVRNRYKLPTAELDDDFIQNLQFKTGMNESEIQEHCIFYQGYGKCCRQSVIINWPIFINNWNHFIVKHDLTPSLST